MIQVAFYGTIRKDLSSFMFYGDCSSSVLLYTLYVAASSNRISKGRILFFFLFFLRCRQGWMGTDCKSPGFDWSGGQAEASKAWSRGEKEILGLWPSFYRLGLRWSRSGRIANLKEGFWTVMKSVSLLTRTGSIRISFQSGGRTASGVGLQ